MFEDLLERMERRFDGVILVILMIFGFEMERLARSDCCSFVVSELRLSELRVSGLRVSL